MQARSIVGAFLGVLLFGATARAQAPVQPGETVRMRAPLVSSRWVEGTLVRLGGDSVVLARRRGDTLAVPSYQVERLERRSGRDHLLGAIRGLGIGIFALAVPAYVAEASSRGTRDDGLDVPIGVALGASLGIVVGSVVGVKRWKHVPVSVPPTQPGARPASPGSPSPAPVTSGRDTGAPSLTRSRGGDGERPMEVRNRPDS